MFIIPRMLVTLILFNVFVSGERFKITKKQPNYQKHIRRDACTRCQSDLTGNLITCDNLFNLGISGKCRVPISVCCPSGCYGWRCNSCSNPIKNQLCSITVLYYIIDWTITIVNIESNASITIPHGSNEFNVGDTVCLNNKKITKCDPKISPVALTFISISVTIFLLIIIIAICLYIKETRGNTASYDLNESRNQELESKYKHINDTDSNESNESNESCSVCIETMTTNIVQLNNCNHMFHETCIKPWIDAGNNCPLCRQ